MAGYYIRSHLYRRFLCGRRRIQFWELCGTSHEQTFEDLSDTRRRVDRFRPLYYGKKVIDFGCGAGTFLRSIQKEARTLRVELQNLSRQTSWGGIECFVIYLSVRSGRAVGVSCFGASARPTPILRQALDLVRPSHGEVVIEFRTPKTS